MDLAYKSKNRGFSLIAIKLAYTFSVEKPINKTVLSILSNLTNTRGENEVQLLLLPDCEGQNQNEELR